ncbi:MAG: WD40 repeat domain-containing protein [Chlamydiales bacterium]
MFMINFLAGQCRSFNQKPQTKPVQQSALEKRVDRDALKHITINLLTNKDRCCLLGCSRSLKQLVEGMAYHQNFQKIASLVTGRCREIAIQNPPSKESRFLVKDPLRFNAFDYDTSSQCVMTGDHGDYREVTVKLWNRSGEMIRQFSKPNDFYKSIISMRLDTRNNRAMGASGSSDGTVRVWNVETGQELFRSRPLDVDLQEVAANLGGNAVLCAGYGGQVQFIDMQHPQDPKLSPVLPKHHRGRINWMCDPSEINRFFLRWPSFENLGSRWAHLPF